VAGYGSYGAFWGVWVVVFAEFLEHHDLSPGQAGLRLVATSVAAVLVMTFVAPRLEGLRRADTVRLGLAVHALGILAVGLVPTGWLFPAFALLGVGTGLVDVFVNAAGHDIESAARAPVLQWAHAGYGLGGAVGAMAAGAALTGGVDFRAIVAVAGAANLAGAVWATRSIGLRGRGRADGGRVALGQFIVSPWLLLPGVVVLSAFFIEGSMDVWSVIFLRETLGASALAGAAGFAAFALATAVGRAFAARVLFGFGYRRTILVSGILSMGAGLTAVLTSSPTVASAAFLVLGFAISAAAPAAFGLAGGEGGGPAIAAVTTVGYTGFLVGPPILGWLAEAVSLRATLAAVAAAAVGILAGAAGRSRRISPEDARDAPFP
jgi:hypothetical protein